MSDEYAPTLMAVAVDAARRLGVGDTLAAVELTGSDIGPLPVAKAEIGGIIKTARRGFEGFSAPRRQQELRRQ